MPRFGPPPPLDRAELSAYPPAAAPDGLLGDAAARARRYLASLDARSATPGDAREPNQYTPELSRRARGVEVWAALASLGRQGLADLVERCCRHATRFAARLAEAGAEVLDDVVLNQVLVAFGGDARTRAVIAAVQADGTCWVGGTEWRGRATMRVS